MLSFEDLPPILILCYLSDTGYTVYFKSYPSRSIDHVHLMLYPIPGHGLSEGSILHACATVLWKLALLFS